MLMPMQMYLLVCLICVETARCETLGSHGRRAGVASQLGCAVGRDLLARPTEFCGDAVARSTR